MIDYKAVAYVHGINSDREAKRLFAKALDITRKTTGDIPQDKLEKEFGDELMDNYQDLLRAKDKTKYRESVKENDIMKNKTRVREFLEDGMDLDTLIEGYDLNEAESYSQDMLNKNTVKGKDLEDDEKEEACKSKKKEYAGDDGKANLGDLDNDKSNGYGSEYFSDGKNSYGTEDSKGIEAKADPYATENPDEVNIGESVEESTDSATLMKSAGNLIDDGVNGEDIKYVDLHQLGYGIGMSLGRAFWTMYRGELSTIELDKFLAGVTKGIS